MKAIAKKTLSVILLILIGVAGRVFFVEVIKIPNLEIVSAFSLLAGSVLGGVFAFLAPLAIISLSDVFIGNTNILLFTWSAFGFIGLSGVFLQAGLPPRQKAIKSLFWCGGFGVLAACFFFLYTNFGWWVLSGMYPHTLSGLVACYINGLPFFKTNLIGDIIFTPLVFSSFFVLKNFLFLTKLKKLGEESIFKEHPQASGQGVRFSGRASRGHERASALGWRQLIASNGQISVASGGALRFAPDKRAYP